MDGQTQGTGPEWWADSKSGQLQGRGRAPLLSLVLSWIGGSSGQALPLPLTLLMPSPFLTSPRSGPGPSLVAPTEVASQKEKQEALLVPAVGEGAGRGPGQPPGSREQRPNRAKSPEEGTPPGASGGGRGGFWAGSWQRERWAHPRARQEGWSSGPGHRGTGPEGAGSLRDAALWRLVPGASLGLRGLSWSALPGLVLT